MIDLKAELHLVSAVEQLGAGLLTLDQELNLRYCNGYAAQYLARPVDACLGHPLLEVFPQLNNAAGQRLLANTLASTEPVRAFLPNDLHPNASGHAASLLAYRFVDEGNHPCVALAIFAPEQSQDTSNTQLLQAQKMQAIAQLAAGAAHEINNPVGFIASNLKTLANYVQQLLNLVDDINEWGGEELLKLKQQYDYDFIRDDISGLLKDSNDGVDRVKNIISGLRQLALDNNPDFTLTDLRQCADTALKGLPSALAASIEITTQHSDLPSIQGHAEQLTQLLSNLLLNAAQAIDLNGSISLRSGSTADSVWLEVEDDGCGISPEQLKQIFDPFYTTRPVGKGSGLGLSLAFNIVQKHHGQISVNSLLGQGSCFTVSLPIKQPLSPITLQDARHE